MKVNGDIEEPLTSAPPSVYAVIFLCNILNAYIFKNKIQELWIEDYIYFLNSMKISYVSNLLPAHS